MQRKKFLIVDGHALIYRSFFAFPPQLTTKTGQMVNAVYGFARILLGAIREIQPTHIAVAFDHPKPTKRHKDFADYKATRPKMPVDLRPQVELVKQVVTALNIPQFELEGYEADDLIGTVNAQLEGRDRELLTIIVTGDKDMFQLVDNDTHVYLPGRGKGNGDREYDAAGVKEKMGVGPEKITDLKGLMGDASDNIPGVRGIGPKTAVALITRFGTLEELYDALDKGVEDPVLKPAVVEKLTEHHDMAHASKQLATIMKDAPVEFHLEECAVVRYDKEKIVALLQELDFQSLIPLLPRDLFETSVQEALF